MTKGKCTVCKIMKVLVGLGALNWGLVGLADIDLVAKLLGDMTGLSRAVYILIGIAGLMTLISVVRCCPCSKGSCEPTSSGSSGSA